MVMACLNDDRTKNTDMYRDEVAGKINSIKTDYSSCEMVEEFKYR